MDMNYCVGAEKELVRLRGEESPYVTDEQQKQFTLYTDTSNSF